MNIFSEFNISAAIYMLLISGTLFWISSSIMLQKRKISQGIPTFLLAIILAAATGVFYFNIHEIVVLEMLVFNSVLLSFLCIYIEIRNP
jgi:hypothetical protein